MLKKSLVCLLLLQSVGYGQPKSKDTFPSEKQTSEILERLAKKQIDDTTSYFQLSTIGDGYLKPSATALTNIAEKEKTKLTKRVYEDLLKVMKTSGSPTKGDDLVSELLRSEKYELTFGLPVPAGELLFASVDNMKTSDIETMIHYLDIGCFLYRQPSILTSSIGLTIGEKVVSKFGTLDFSKKEQARVVEGLEHCAWDKQAIDDMIRTEYLIDKALNKISQTNPDIVPHKTSKELLLRIKKKLLTQAATLQDEVLSLEKRLSSNL